MLNIWVGNLGKYNEGELVGDWLELPVSEKELEKFLREKVGLQLTQEEVEEALKKDGICYEEYMINDYDTDLPIKVGEYSNIKLLNLLALASENVYDMEQVNAYVECEGTENIEEIINIMLQEDNIPYYTYEVDSGWISKEEKYGMMKADMMGLTEILEKYGITDFFDFEGYGREDDLSGCIELYEDGYIDKNAMNDVDPHKYSLEEIREELDIENYNSEEEQEEMDL